MRGFSLDESARAEATMMASVVRKAALESMVW